LRQAYDYWQNQPGNYLGRGCPRRPGREAGQSCTLRGGRDRSGPGPGARLTGLICYPIAPTEFPTGSSPLHAPGARRLDAGGDAPRKRRMPVGNHVRGRLFPEAYPQVSWIKRSHRPAIFRLQPCLPAELIGRRALP